MDDHDIIQKILNGDINQFELLIEKYSTKVFSIVCKRVPQGDYELVAQDVFIKVFQSLSTFKTAKPFENWLVTIAVRTCYDYWRSHYRSRQIDTVRLEEKHEEWLKHIHSAHSIEQFNKEESKRAILEILDIVLKKLSPEDRLLVDLIYFENWKLKDAAEILNWTLGKTKIRAMRARKRLRQEIEAMLKLEVEVK